MENQVRMLSADVDIVIPLYRSEEALPFLLEKLNEWILSQSKKVHVIFVEDGSLDATYATLLQLWGQYSFSKSVYRLSKNYGQQTATSVGFRFSTAPIIVTIDDDLQHDPFQIDKLLQVLNDADLVYGIYEVKKHHFFRNIGTKILQQILWTSGTDYRGVTSFRAMKSSVIQRFKISETSVVFVDEYLQRNASQIVKTQIQHAERKHGKSTYSGFKLFRFALQILLFHTEIPLRFITRFGLIMSLTFFALGCVFIYQKLFYSAQLGFTSLIVAIFFSTGMILLSLGIIGEYIRKIWVNQQHLNQVIIREKK